MKKGGSKLFWMCICIEKSVLILCDLATSFDCKHTATEGSSIPSWQDKDKCDLSSAVAMALQVLFTKQKS